jgi:hypothetical protein
LYRADFKTFEAYCKERWGWTRRNADLLISASETATEIENNCSQFPATESQCRPPAKLPIESRADAWEEVIERAPKAEDGTPKVTAKLTRSDFTWNSPRPVYTGGRGRSMGGRHKRENQMVNDDFNDFGVVRLSQADLDRHRAEQTAADRAAFDAETARIVAAGKQAREANAKGVEEFRKAALTFLAILVALKILGVF